MNIFTLHVKIHARGGRAWFDFHRELYYILIYDMPKYACVYVYIGVCVKFLSNKQFGIINKSDYQCSFVSGNFVSLPLLGQGKDKSW